MPVLLRIDSSSLGEASISRQLTENFVEKWKALHAGGEVVTRDLFRSEIPPISAEWIAARGKPAAAYSAEEQELMKLSDTLIEELQRADEYVFGVPMYNFGVPAVLKLWIDQIARPGRTFSYADGSPKGMLTGKKATFLVASGGAYDAGTMMASFNFVEPYLRTVFGFLGVTDSTFINAGGTMAVNYGKIDRESYLQPHIELIERQLVAA
jgi:FMN-dependent NADH-azoreductase